MHKKLDFITPTLMTVSDLFLSDPMQEYHEREVVRKSKARRGSANKMLRLLTRLNFLTREKKGKMVFYKLNSRETAVKQFKIMTNVFALTELTDRRARYSFRMCLANLQYVLIERRSADRRSEGDKTFSVAPRRSSLLAQSLRHSNVRRFGFSKNSNSVPSTDFADSERSSS